MRESQSTRRQRCRAALIAALLLYAAGIAQAAAPAAQPPIPRSAELMREVEAWRVCARLNLPADFRHVRDPASAVAVALEKCRRQRFAVAGQYALDYPGTVRTKAFVDGLSVQLVEELSAWVEDVHAQRISPHPPQRPRQ